VISGVALLAAGPRAQGRAAADGGRAGVAAGLAEPRLRKAFARFGMAWRWDGGPAILQSRAWDESGNAQPTREQFGAKRGQTSKPPSVRAFPGHHFNAVTSWAVDRKGEVHHAYA